MIEFENLWVLWLLIIAFFLPFFTSKTKISNFRPEILSKIYVKSRGFSKRIRKILLILSFIFCIIALARPILNNGEIKVRKDFINLAIGIDISNSMIVDDVFPNRFEFAKNKIFSFLKNANDKEISLLGFSDRAFLISPLTNDFNSLSFLLKNLNFNHLKLKGTSVMSLLESVKSLSDDGGALVIFTDGGDNENFEKEIEFANKNNIKVFVYLVATDKGGLLKSENGKMVLLKANHKIRDLALNTGGDIMQYSFENSDMGSLNKIISSKFSAKSEEDEIIKDKKELFYYPLILAIILFFMANFHYRKGEKREKILLLIIFLNLSFAKIFDFYYENKANSAYFDGDFKKAAKSYAKIDSQKAKYNEGVSLYRDGNYTGAIEKFKEVEAEELKFEKLYNLGNSYAKLEEIDKAIENYEKALKIKNDEDAKFNLELLKKQKNKKEQKNDTKEQKNDTKDNDNSKDDKNMNQKNQDSKDSNSDNQKKNEEEKDQNHQPNKHKTQSDDENLNNQKSDNNGSKQKEQNFKYDKEKAINELEQKRWQNILQKRDIGTFIVPLKNSKEKNENLKPW